MPLIVWNKLLDAIEGFAVGLVCAPPHKIFILQLHIDKKFPSFYFHLGSKGNLSSSSAIALSLFVRAGAFSNLSINSLAFPLVCRSAVIQKFCALANSSGDSSFWLSSLSLTIRLYCFSEQGLLG